MSGIYKSEAGAEQLRARYRLALQAWPVEHEQLRVPTPEGETFVVASGPAEAPALLLLHGSGSNSAQWMGQIPGYAEHFRVFAVDVIGEPGFSAPSRPPLRSDRYARWLDAVLDHLGLDTVRIAGVSLGGWLALDYASRRPDRVRALALTCPVGLSGPRYGFLLQTMLLKLLGRRGRRRALAKALGPAAAAVFGEGSGEAIAEHQDLVAKSYRYRSGAVPVFDDAALRRLTMPVQVIAGVQDAFLRSAQTKRRLEATAPRATVQLLPGVGHLVPPQPAELEFLTERVG